MRKGDMESFNTDRFERQARHLHGQAVRTTEDDRLPELQSPRVGASGAVGAGGAVGAVGTVSMVSMARLGKHDRRAAQCK